MGVTGRLGCLGGGVLYTNARTSVTDQEETPGDGIIIIIIILFIGQAAGGLTTAESDRHTYCNCRTHP